MIIILNFGRYNPVTTGHEKLANVMRAAAAKLNADARIYLSHSHDAKRNPIDYDTKLKIAQAAFGNLVYPSESRTIIEIMKELEADGYTDVVFVAGDDRSEFGKVLQGRNGKDYNFRSIKMLSAGHRDDDVGGVEGISGTKMREFALNNDLESFTNGLPTNLRKAAATIMKIVRNGMMPELTESDEEVLDILLDEDTEVLDELKMTPKSFAAFSQSEFAKTVQVGFEAEMIVPNMINTDRDDYESEPDYDEDGYVDTSSFSDLKNDLARFFSETATRTSIERAVNEVSERIYEEFLERDFQEYLKDEKDELYQMYRDWTNLETDEEIQNSIDDEDSDYDRVVDKMRDDFNSRWQPDLGEALEYFGLPMYSDWDNEYGWGWPHWTTAEYGTDDEISYESMKTVADEIEKVIDMPIKAAPGYHAFSSKEPGIWYLETDSSIDADASEGEGGLELVSPPMPLDEALEKLDTVFRWMLGYGARTDSSTGFHMGVSVPNMDKVDFVKLILFLGDTYILEQFGRLGNSYTRSSLNRMETVNAPHLLRNMPGIFDAMRQGIDTMAMKLIGNSLAPKGDRYVSVNIKDKYIEFRSAGGDYVSQFDKIKETMLRYVRVMGIASDPEEAKHEYAKKLYSVLMNSSSGDDANTVKWFTLYATGNLPKNELIQKVKDAQASRQIKKIGPDAKLGTGSVEYKVVSKTTGEKLIPQTIMANDEKAALAYVISNPIIRKLLPTYIDIREVSIVPAVLTGQWKRYVIHAYDDNGRSVPMHAVSARDQREASHLAFQWGGANNRVVTGVTTESIENKTLADYIATVDRPFVNESSKPSGFSDWHWAHIMGGHLYEGE